MGKKTEGNESQNHSNHGKHHFIFDTIINRNGVSLYTKKIVHILKLIHKLLRSILSP